MIESLKIRRGRIIRIDRHSALVKSIYVRLEEGMDVWPGQFILWWVPGLEEIPLSPSYCEGDILRITVMARGETTRRIHSFQVGDEVFLKGPFGRGFRLERGRRYLLVAGGYGAAPIIYSLHVLNDLGGEAVYVVGARSRDGLLFLDEARSLGVEAYAATEDGSYGRKGLVTQVVEEILDEGFEVILACGPEGMLAKILRLCLEEGVEGQLSMERIIKCGVGLCGSCLIRPRGLLVCRDGPVFDARDLADAELEGGQHG
jgi:dihydroorotate dehydrogenase electron transfer subunit